VTAGALILIVEDNEKNLKLARDLLRVKGFQTLEARTAEEGLELARAHRPKVVLMDIQLPGQDGFAALRVLRADPATADLIVIAFTASVMTDDVARVQEAGFDGFIAKPISVREFSEQVRRLLEQR